MKIKKFWLWAIAICLIFIMILVVQTASAFTIAPDGWMTATAEFEKVTCSWSGVKPDYCPTQTPKPVWLITQEFLEFCGSTPYQQVGCPYEPTSEITLQTYPGVITDDDYCATATYPGPECGIFSDLSVHDPLNQNLLEQPTPTPTRWLISRPRDRKARQP